MIDAILAFSIRQRWLVMIAVFAIAASAPGTSRGCRSTRFPTSPTCRCRSIPRPGLFAAGSRAAHHLPDRDRDGRAAAPRIHPLAVALRTEPGDRRVQGRHRHLFRAPARQRAHPAGQGSTADGHPDRDGSDLDRARRNLHVRGRSQARRAQRQGRALQLRPICGRSRTGSSSRSCAPFPASSRSTRSAATRSNSTCCRTRRD